MLKLIGKAVSDAITRASSSNNNSNTQSQMKKNSEAWHGADAVERKRLESENQKLGSQIGASYNASAGTWSSKDTGQQLYSTSNNNTSKINNTKTTSTNKRSDDDYDGTSADFNTKYDQQIRGIASANEVDMSVGREMFTANLNNSMMGLEG